MARSSEPPPPADSNSWEDAITEMIDDEFNGQADDNTAQGTNSNVFGGGRGATSSTTARRTQRQVSAVTTATTASNTTSTAGMTGDLLGDDLDEGEGLPENIMQPVPSDESNPLITLDSLESGKDSTTEDDDKIQRDNSACLEVESSGSSKGSQGSYADQVPALSGSASTGKTPAALIGEDDAAKRSELGSPWTLPSDNEENHSSGGSSNAQSSNRRKGGRGSVDPFSVTESSLSTHQQISADTQGSSSNDFEAVQDLLASEIGGGGMSTSEEPLVSSHQRIFSKSTTTSDESPLVSAHRSIFSGESSMYSTKEPSQNSKSISSDPFRPGFIPSPTAKSAPAPPESSSQDNQKKQAAAPSPFFDHDDDARKEQLGLTIKTSFSSGFGSQPQGSEDSGDTQGRSIISNVSALVNRFAQIEEQDDGAEDLDDILGAKGQPPASSASISSSSMHQYGGGSNVISLVSPATDMADMAGIFSLPTGSGSTSLPSNPTSTLTSNNTSSDPSNRSQRSSTIPLHGLSSTTLSTDRDGSVTSNNDSDRSTSMRSSERATIGEPSMYSERTGRSVLAAVSEGSDDFSEMKSPLHGGQKSTTSKSSDPAIVAASQQELDQLMRATKGTTAAILLNQTSTSEQEGETNRSARTLPPLDKIVQSLERHEAQHTRPPHYEPETPSQRGSAFCGGIRIATGGPTTPSAHDQTTFDSQDESYYQSTAVSETPVSKDGTSFWTNSEAGSFTPRGGGRSMATSPAESSEAGSSYTQSECFSPGSTTAVSTTQHTRGTMSTAPTDTYHTRGTYQSTNLWSPQETITEHTDRTDTERTITERTGITTTTGRTAYTERTEVTASTAGTQSTAVTQSTAGTEGAASSAASEDPQRSEAAAGSTESEGSDMKGGRLWELANKEASNTKSNSYQTPEASRFAESLMARTRSRADPDAIVNTTSNSLDRDSDPPNMVKIGQQEDEKFIVQTAHLRKRVRVVQLLIVGLLALLVSFLGAFWVQSSCYFVSATVEVGEEGQVFDLHYGMWKYSPIDSAFQGYAYCFQYDEEYTSDAPLLSRWFSCVAMACVSFSLFVLWFYLIFGRGNRWTWNLSVLAAFVAGCCQFLTMVIFAGNVCQRDDCSLGPAGVLSICSGIVNFILAFEMQYNTPMALWVIDGLSECPSNEQPGNLMANLEMTDFRHGAEAYVARMVAGEAKPYKTLNQIQRDNKNPIGEMMFDRDLANSENSYKPPALIV